MDDPHKNLTTCGACQCDCHRKGKSPPPGMAVSEVWTRTLVDGERFLPSCSEKCATFLRDIAKNKTRRKHAA